MQSKELIQTAFQLSYQLVLPLLDDLKTAPLVAPTSSGGNHAHWTLGHLVVSEAGFHSMMRGIPNPVEPLKEFFSGRTTPDPHGTNYPPYAELLSMLISMRQQTSEWVATLTEEDLDRASHVIPPGFEAAFGTWRSCMLMMSLHWMNHRGQLADCRRAAGRERLML